MKTKKPYIPEGIKLLVIITSNSQIDKMLIDLATHGVYYSNAVRGRGTANQEVLDFLGIGETDKTLLFCLADQGVIPSVLEYLENDKEYVGGRKGIAFTMSLDCIASVKAIKEIVRMKEMED